MAEEDDGELQKEEVDRTIGASRERFEGMVAFLELVRSSGDDRQDVLVTRAARRALSSLEKMGQRRC